MLKRFLIKNIRDRKSLLNVTELKDIFPCLRMKTYVPSLMVLIKKNKQKVEKHETTTCQ